MEPVTSKPALYFSLIQGNKAVYDKKLVSCWLVSAITLHQFINCSAKKNVRQTDKSEIRKGYACTF